ncbi:MAG TPA: ATPase domain-containing protein [Candidatus Nanoarchaeia archaeon]|nr:ATPase domain-containing protein [Candidatus Nanoarchaeia archaeon]
MESGLKDKVKEGKEEELFLTKEGITVSNLRELREFLSMASDEVFHHHVDGQKNDFENWIRHSLKNQELADLLRNKKTKEDTIMVLDYFLTKQELENPEAGIRKEEIPPVERIKIGIHGFDELITEGIPLGSSVLISGGPGTGKTTFCLQILKEAAEKGEKCLYLTFEEDPLRLKQHMKSYGWDPVRLEKEGNLIIRKMQPFDLSRSVEALLAKASGELIIELDEIEGIIPEGFKPDRIVLDSLSAVAAAFIGKEEGYRIYIEQLFNLFKSIGATSFLITEIEQEANKYSRSGIEEFLADAVFVFYNIRQKNVRLNALEILKVRGTLHQKKIVPFKIISNQGLVAYPQEEVFT